jgi:hypothetical protein
MKHTLVRLTDVREEAGRMTQKRCYVAWTSLLLLLYDYDGIKFINNQEVSQQNIMHS